MAEKGEMIGFCEAAKKYEERIKFILFHEDTDPTLSGNNHEKLLQMYGVSGTPTLGLYGTFDILNGETPDNNPGILKRVDIATGGVSEFSHLKYGLSVFSFWIDSNFFPTQKEFITRGNGGSIRKVYLSTVRK